MEKFETLMKILSLQDVENFLIENHWERRKSSNEKIASFLGPKDDKGSRLEVVLPTTNQFADYDMRITDALRIISIVEAKDIINLLSEITLKSYDIFRARLLNVHSPGSIPLKAALTDITALRDFFTYAACSEVDSRPDYFRPLPSVSKYVQKCQFGHTFKGSFGFTIHTPITLDDNQIPSQKTFERRVMERIIRSFEIINRSLMENDPDIIIKNYETGLNARMCQSLLKLLESGYEVEFDVLWSPRIAVPKALAAKNVWWFGRTSFEVISFAAEELKKVARFRNEPNQPVMDNQAADRVINQVDGRPVEIAAKLIEEVKSFEGFIIGYIITLHSSANNSRANNRFFGRVVMECIYEGRQISVDIELLREQYILALDAHKLGRPVRVFGIIHYNRYSLRISNINKFELD
jgi:hypothetical protein